MCENYGWWCCRHHCQGVRHSTPPSANRKTKRVWYKRKYFELDSEFLCDRTQVVRVNGAQSAPAPVVSGIPQATVLGPVLFVIYINSEERLKRLNLPTLAYRRLSGNMNEIYKHFHTYDKEIISTSFQPRERTTRKHDFQILNRKPKDGIRGIQSNSFYYRSPNIWNDLPRAVVNAKNINSFKNQLDEFWKEIPIMFDHISNL